MLIKTAGGGKSWKVWHFLIGNANRNRRRRRIFEILTFFYREMLIGHRRRRGFSEMWTFTYRDMLIKTAGGGQSVKSLHFPIGKHPNFKNSPPPAVFLWKCLNLKDFLPPAVFFVFSYRGIPKSQKFPASGGFPLYFPIGKCPNLRYPPPPGGFLCIFL